MHLWGWPLCAGLSDNYLILICPQSYNVYLQYEAGLYIFAVFLVAEELISFLLSY